MMEETQDIEDLDDILRANAILERIRNGEEQCYLLEDIERELGLRDFSEEKDEENKNYE